jgi:hypothetical protein
MRWADFSRLISDYRPKKGGPGRHTIIRAYAPGTEDIRGECLYILQDTLVELHTDHSTDDTTIIELWVALQFDRTYRADIAHSRAFNESFIRHGIYIPHTTFFKQRCRLDPVTALERKVRTNVTESVGKHREEWSMKFRHNQNETSNTNDR